MDKLFALLFSKPVVLVLAIIGAAVLVFDLWLGDRLGRVDRFLMVIGIVLFLVIAAFSLLTMMVAA